VKRTYLFDVDGTLVKSGGAGSRALNLAFQRLYGGDGEAMAGVRLHGRTDYAICRDAFARRYERSPVPNAEIAALLEVYLPLLEEEVARSATYQVLPGVSDLLESLRSRGHLLGLATGNIERGARIKIARGGLNGFFAFGGFGDDSEDRSVLTRIARERARAARGDDDRGLVYVIGDTVLDVTAAKAAGCRSVAVASGWEDAATLRASGADYFFESLAEALGAAPFD
jgi:phosphoglycolate phosphatase-like HAD superfamily hydrolase